MEVRKNRTPVDQIKKGRQPESRIGVIRRILVKKREKGCVGRAGKVERGLSL